jgi:predicted nucleic acid-binding protein
MFADSSALVTLYAEEPGRNNLFGDTPIVVSQLARVEVPAALWRKHRLAELEPDQARVLTEEFEADFFGTAAHAPRFVAVAVTATVLDAAARLCAAHGLRAYDAVQLSAALGARAADRECTHFAAYDDGLRRAAAAEGFRLLPASAK